jgi:hypothetical protein
MQDPGLSVILCVKLCVLLLVILCVSYGADSHLHVAKTRGYMAIIYQS